MLMRALLQTADGHFMICKAPELAWLPVCGAAHGEGSFGLDARANHVHAHTCVVAQKREERYPDVV